GMVGVQHYLVADIHLLRYRPVLEAAIAGAYTAHWGGCFARAACDRWRGLRRRRLLRQCGAGKEQRRGHQSPRDCLHGVLDGKKILESSYGVILVSFRPAVPRASAVVPAG